MAPFARGEKKRGIGGVERREKRGGKEILCSKGEFKRTEEKIFYVERREQDGENLRNREERFEKTEEGDRK